MTRYAALLALLLAAPAAADTPAPGAAPSGAPARAPAAASGAPTADGTATAAKKLPGAADLLDAMDRNLTFETRTARITMVVEGRGRTRTYEMVIYGRGQEDSAVEYLAPAREKGTRMLKLGDELWIYMPSIDRVQKISGHMLRQGMMGSDVSYEDLMASRELRERYDAKVVGEETQDGRPCYRLEMTAKDESVTYPRRVVWIDEKTLVPVRQELYAVSGMLLKTWTMSDVKTFEGGREFPTKMTVEDHVKKDSITRLSFDELRFGIDLEDEVFSLRWLERR